MRRSCTSSTSSRARRSLSRADLWRRRAGGPEDRHHRSGLDRLRAQPDRRSAAVSRARRRDHARADGRRPRAPGDVRGDGPPAHRGVRRCGARRGDRGPARRARRRRLRDHLLPGRRSASGDDGRLRGPDALRGPSDDRRHARASAGSCAACGRSRCCSTSAATWRSYVRTRCCCSTSTRWRCCAGRSPRRARSARWACATPSSTPPGSSRPRSRSSRAEVDYVVAGINHVAFFLSLERDGEDLYPRLRELVETDRVPARGPRPVRGPAPPRLLRDRVLRALRRVRAVVHQVGPARPDRAVRDPARRVPAALRTPDRGVGGDASRLQNGWRSGATSTADIINACETGEPFRFNGNVPNASAGGQLIDNLPASCCVEVPCVAGERGIEPRAVGALPAPSGRADPDERQRAGTDRVGRADRAPRAGVPRGDARSAHGRRVAARRDRGARRRVAVGSR